MNQIHQYARQILHNERARINPGLQADLEYIFNGGAIYIPNGICKASDTRLFEAIRKELEHSGEMVQWSRHLKHENPEFSPTFKRIIQQLSEWFGVEVYATRLNYYPNGQAWKPFHHDSHAYVDSEKKEDFTMGVSLGASRKLAFRHPHSEEFFEFPQHNGDIFAFDTEVNRRFMHGVPHSQSSEPRISIIAWGKRSHPGQFLIPSKTTTTNRLKDRIKERIQQRGSTVQNGWNSFR